ncbi:MAG: hypothetical protein C4536_05830 [Actinobacteria bacterium]|jgi:hypothetical protein|nr:MAG: hypothetical protein C4536_05830 [Actinomycetota bacterium]
MPKKRSAERRIAEIKEKISGMYLVCAGTLQERMKTCGRSYCRCSEDPEAMHGPYYEWTRYVDGRLVSKTLSPEQARVLEKAIANYRETEDLLNVWKQISAESILGMKKQKG